MRIWLLATALRLVMLLSFVRLGRWALGTCRCTSSTSATRAVPPLPVSCEGASYPAFTIWRTLSGAATPAESTTT